MRRIAGAIGALLLSGAAPVDWKLFAHQSAPNGGTYIFYLASEIVHTSDRHVQVWTKQLRGADLHRTVASADENKNAQQRISAGYQPPLATLVGLSAADTLALVIDEQRADDSSITPDQRTLMEVDCANNRERSLEIVLKTGRRTTKPSEWEVLLPKSIGDMLRTLVFQ